MCGTGDPARHYLTNILKNLRAIEQLLDIFHTLNLPVSTMYLCIGSNIKIFSSTDIFESPLRIVWTLSVVWSISRNSLSLWATYNNGHNLPLHSHIGTMRFLQHEGCDTNVNGGYYILPSIWPFEHPRNEAHSSTNYLHVPDVSYIYFWNYAGLLHFVYLDQVCSIPLLYLAGMISWMN